MNGKEPLKMMEMLVIHQLSLFFSVYGEAQKNIITPQEITFQNFP